MKLLIGIILGLTIGALCQFFNIPVPAPPVIDGALLVIAMTLGYGVADKYASRSANSTANCGGPDGTSTNEGNG